jgi:type III pantothenate kinase
MTSSKAPGATSKALALTVDIGNTHSVMGLFRGAAVLKRWRLATRKDTTVDEIALWLSGMVVPYLAGQKLQAAALASVVPTQDEAWRGAIAEIFGVAPRILDWRDCGGLELHYEIPRQIGADRLANVLGAKSLGYGEGVIIDLGTATTFDVFQGNAYLGGIICPGIQTSMRTLVSNTAKLSEAELRWPQGFVGKTTDEAMRVGILRGTVGLVGHLLDGILKECGMREPAVIATGGLAVWVKDRHPKIRAVEPDLTLIGLNHLLSLPAVTNSGGGRAPTSRKPLTRKIQRA